MKSTAWDHIVQQFQLPFTNPVLVFTLVLFVILIAPMLMSKIKAPGIVGFIVAGTVIGPHGLNLLTRSPAIELFSTIGLLYIMFIAGLDLDIAEFNKMKHKSFTFGLLTFSIPILIGLPVCYWILGYPLLTSLLTASMFATHTLVAYPIAARYGTTKNEAAAITVGGTILTDTAVLIILAVILGAKNGSLSASFWLQLIGSFIVFVLLVGFVIPRIAKWFLSRQENGKTLQYVFVLLCLFVSAFLSQLAGIEPIVGAFIAGLALNPLIPKLSTLKSNIDFTGNAIFIPFFLIGVGMLVDLHVLFNGTRAVVIAITLTAVALAGKWLASFFTQRIFKYSNVQRKLIFGLSSSHAAATLAIILVGYKLKIIDANILNGTIVLILVTCLVASFTTELASREISEKAK